MNWVDLAILAVLVFSGILAFMRGLVREVLGIGAWIGAGFFSIWSFQFVQARFRGWIGSPDIADPAAFGAMFLVALLFLSIVAGLIGSVVRGSLVGGLDRTLGIAFGVVRGAALVVFAYIAGCLIVATDKWPEPVLQARTLPYAYQGALWAASFVPEDYRPRVIPPPSGREATSADLLQATPQGRATAKP